MSTSPSLDATGLHVLRTADVLLNLQEAVLASSEYGPATPVGEDSLVGQIIAPVSHEIGMTYELIQSAYDASDRDTAEGVVLDSIAAGMGLTREPASYSTVPLTLTGTPATVIAAGKRARVNSGGIFALDHETTIPGGGSIAADATCTSTGAVEASAGSVETIVDAVAGWTGVTNAAAAELGAPEETDPALRLRMRTSGSTGGRCTVPSLYAALLALEYVDQVVVLTNRTDVTDAEGLPPHSFRALIWPSGLTTAQEEEIAAIVWDHLPAGIYPSGTEECHVTNAEGVSDTVRFSYAGAVYLWWGITATLDTDAVAEPYPTDGDDLIEAAVLAYGATLTVGKDVLPAVCAAYILGGYRDSDGVQQPGVPGIRTMVVEVQVGEDPSGHTDPLTITPTLIAVTEVARITVVSS
jgi:hypothetical protein